MRSVDSNLYEVDPPVPNPAAVLIVEDERVSRRALLALLRARGFNAEAVATAEEAVALLRSRPSVGRPVALVDLDLPGMNGLEFIELMRKTDAGIDPILITAADREKIRDALEAHPIPFMQKPLDLERLVSMLNERQLKH